MREQKYHFSLSEKERRFLIQNLFWFQNKLRQEGWYTDAVDDLIIKLSKAKPKKIRVPSVTEIRCFSCHIKNGNKLIVRFLCKT